MYQLAQVGAVTETENSHFNSRRNTGNEGAFCVDDDKLFHTTLTGGTECTVAYGIVSEIQRDIGRKSRFSHKLLPRDAHA